MMTATYSPEDNKLRLYSVARLDADTYKRVRAAGFIWAAKQGLFVAPAWTPSREDLLIDLCGEIGDEDTSLVDRAEQRAERFDGYQENRKRDAEQAHNAVKAIADNIPLGQPILVGHHSERHARKDAERIENGMRKAVKMWDTAQYWKSRAAGALAHAKYKELPTVRARRIKTLETDKRRQERIRDEAAKWIKAWGYLNDPHRGEKLGPNTYAMDAAPCDDALRLKRALWIANYSHVSILREGTTDYDSVWSLLDKGAITPREAQLRSVKAHGRTIARARRWIAHLDNRLTYERAMLDEQGRADLLAPKARPKQLPLCNYRAPEGITVTNPYQPGPMTLAQIEMTQAEYTAIHTDYKGTRVCGNSHRVRTALTRDPGGAYYQRSLYCVFLTDSKIHTPPAPIEKAPRVEHTPRPEPRAYVASERTPFDDMRDSLKQGVRVVSAPQLFPTPAHVARQLVELAEICEGDRVLEPSAGTGSIASAVATQSRGSLLCVEINRALADGLTHAGYVVECKDFLACNGDLGTFDRVVMNPPFEHAIDIKHIAHAMHFLRPGGRLTAICAAGSRQRAYAEQMGMEWIDLPPDTFASQGTGVNTAIVVYEKPEVA